MKTKLLILFFALAWCTCFSQITIPGRIDSLKQALTLTQSDEDRVMILSDLSYEYLGSDTDSALLLAQQAHDLAQKINFTRGEARALFHLGHTWRILSDIPKSMRASLRGVQLAEESGFRQEAALCNYNTGALYMDLLNDYPKALSYFKKARQWNSPMQGVIGESCRLTLDINFGNVYEHLDMLDSSEFYYNEALDHMTIAPGMRPVILNFQGLLQLKLKNYPEALALLREAIAKKLSHRSSAEIYFNLASCFREMGQTDSCLFYAKNSLAEAEQIGYQKYSMKAATLLAEVYEGENNPEALRFYKIAKLANDEVYGEQKVQDLQRIITDEMQRQQEAERERTTYENRVRLLALLGGLAVVLLVAFLLYRNNRQKQKSNAKLQAQNRELEIEASLERIRARALAMHKSSEIKAVAGVMRNELLGLGLEGVSAATIWLEQPNGKIRAWDFTIVENSSLDKDVQVDVEFDPKDAPPRAHFHKIWNRRGNYWVGESGLEDLYESVNWLKTQDEAAATEMLHLLDSGELKYWWHPTTVLEKGRLNVDFVVQPPEEMATILLKMAAVFDLAYRRFEDLQKAEAQAREAQIEAALERVRSQTMAMHKSEELEEVVKVLTSQFSALRPETVGCWIATIDAQANTMEIWQEGGGVLQPSFTVKGSDHPNFQADIDAFKNKESYRQFFLLKEDVIPVFRELFNYEFGEIPEDATEYHLLQIRHNFGYLGFSAWKKADEEAFSIIQRFAKVFEQTYTRFLDLQKAEAQAREAQIEAALERVRSRTMAMHKSDELAEVVALIYKEAREFQLADWGCNIQIIDEAEQMEFWISGGSHDYLPKPYYFKNTGHEAIQKQLTAFKKKEDYTLHLQGEEKKSYDDFVLEHTDFKYFPEEIKAGIRSEDRVHFTAAFMKYGYIVSVNLASALSPEQFDLLSRFAKVFEQTYTRFLDLQRAEAQAREAQIEAALERVRSRTMGMQSSKELSELVEVVYQQFNSLHIANWGANIMLMHPEEPSQEIWLSENDQKVFPHSFFIRGMDSLFTREQWEGWNSNKEQFTLHLFGDKKKEYDDTTFEYHDFRLLPDVVKEGIRQIKDAYFSFYRMRYGFLVAINAGGKISAEGMAVLGRFAKVFEQTYTRFLDLQRAEEQAREAQIEAALERVRSRAIAMRHSDELSEAAELLYQEFLKMGVESFSCGYLINDDEKDEWKIWLTNPGEPFFKEFSTIPYDADHNLKARYESWKRGDEFHSAVLQGEENRAHHIVIGKYAPWKADLADNLPPQLVFNSAHFSLGHLFVLSPEKLPAELEQAMVRFAKVFDLAYRRFLDLQKAEARAREERIEAGLDRVRAEIASMRSTDDLERITPLVWRELTHLEVPFFRCGVFIMDEEKELVHTYLSTPGGQSLSVLHLPFDSSATTRNTVTNWRKQEVYLDNWGQQQFVEWMQTLMEQGYLKEGKAYQGTEQPPETLALHFVPFKQGMLYVGNTEKLSQEQIDLVQRLADTFTVAYARYEDFTKLEEAKRKVETTLTELKATQSQLIQSEKLASLGELTASIAHEIQNPLNFVNNFSEMSVDLAEELKEEIKRPEKDWELIEELMDDLTSNQQKINHHGKRAAGIVTAMLQHSRTSTGTKEPTDLNALADEYLRLAYHGLRAKDPTFNAKMETDFDPSVGKVDVIPQDIGRVFLNIINNAFYATQQRASASYGVTSSHPVTSPYQPTVSISSKKENGQVVFKIKDNGTGIPDDVKVKIFQPFFTTKPTGQGTGLGLSLAYDIITKGHGGTLEVETREGEGTEFILHFPDSLK